MLDLKLPKVMLEPRNQSNGQRLKLPKMHRWTQGSVTMVTNDTLRERGIKGRISRDQPKTFAVLILLVVIGFLIWVLTTA